MDISAASFRDKRIKAFSVVYDWEAECHSAEISIQSADNVVHRYRINRLSEINVSDDFGSREIAFCSLILSPGRVYLSFDPHTEGVESDRDNFIFVGSEIVRVD